ncbi:hypothetical protein GCM10011415_09680 [Salipiger pallidus]|uniref:Uncharacterized protein n=1 Tax=Salipiger pallidus TaxID=1775170 RepID=A0A8J2ZHU1_9RHOB|nr:hypothetical protein [Salipiger pallidus]GGG65005.1 hypothetical protein GCM10011415_09680 [Salipiger pallidus]
MGTALPPTLAGDDFAFFPNVRPGALIWTRDSAALHHPAYDLDDGGIPRGIASFTGLAQARLAAEAG